MPVDISGLPKHEVLAALYNNVCGKTALLSQEEAFYIVSNWKTMRNNKKFLYFDRFKSQEAVSNIHLNIDITNDSFDPSEYDETYASQIAAGTCFSAQQAIADLRLQRERNKSIYYNPAPLSFFGAKSPAPDKDEVSIPMPSIEKGVTSLPEDQAPGSHCCIQ